MEIQEKQETLGTRHNTNTKKQKQPQKTHKTLSTEN
jgi:hypothetical protein